jgi:hypothetical protein
MRLCTVIAVVFLASLSRFSHAGEETTHLGEAGAPAPVGHAGRVRIESFRAWIAFPQPDPNLTHVPAVIHAELDLEDKHLDESPLQVEVGFPVGYPGMRLTESYQPAVTEVKLDGEPVPARLLHFSELAVPIMRRWPEEVDRLLAARPDVQQAVEQYRSAEALPADHIAELTRWLAERFPEKKWRVQRERAMVLLGHWSPPWEKHQRVDFSRNVTLRWLDPDCEITSLYRELSEEWGHAELMLDPFTGHLASSEGMWGEQPFGAVVFPIEVKPGTTHKLAVLHKQELGKQNALYGLGRRFQWLRYVMTSLGRWGSGLKAVVVDIVVPDGWGDVAIRPPPTDVVPQDGATVYRIETRGRPLEEIYVSVLAPEA